MFYLIFKMGGKGEGTMEKLERQIGNLKYFMIFANITVWVIFALIFF